jgi:hypothetical protein
LEQEASLKLPFHIDALTAAGKVRSHYIQAVGAVDESDYQTNYWPIFWLSAVHLADRD